MVMRMLTSTPFTNSEIIFAFIGSDAMCNAIFTETIQHTVYGHSVHFTSHLLLYTILAKRRIGIPEYFQYHLLSCCISSFHKRELLLQQCCNNKHFIYL